ncbi:MAG: hypothetical protein R2912_12530 [Eubacteriales bacterium]
MSFALALRRRYDLRRMVSVDSAILANDFFAERFNDARIANPAGIERMTRDFVRVVHMRAKRGKAGGNR